MLRIPTLQETDGADRLLMAEQSHLLSLKRALETQLRRVQLQQQELGAARTRVAAVMQERSRVTDLLCNSMRFATTYKVGGQSDSGLKTPTTGRRDMTRSVSSMALPKSRPSSARDHTPFSAYRPEWGEEDVLEMSRPPSRAGGGSSSIGSHHKAYSAPLPLNLGALSGQPQDEDQQSVSVIDLDRPFSPAGKRYK